MSEEQALQQKINNGFQASLEKFNEDHFKDMQYNMHIKIANCYKTSTTEGLQNCIDQASHPVNVMNNYLQNEINGLQNRLTRCISECRDLASDKFTSQKDEKAAHKFLLSCSNECADKTLSQAKAMQSRLDAEANRIKKSI